mmetsp:Transcript_95912/g.140121  ORF Transcript_95912/g.140121 Transcript_95912/m.140121 type:complete len:232 (+) Transcript_95912:275-970(+)
MPPPQRIQRRLGSSACVRGAKHCQNPIWLRALAVNWVNSIRSRVSLLASTMFAIPGIGIREGFTTKRWVTVTGGDVSTPHRPGVPIRTARAIRVTAGWSSMRVQSRALPAWFRRAEQRFMSGSPATRSRLVPMARPGMKWIVVARLQAIPIVRRRCQVVSPSLSQLAIFEFSLMAIMLTQACELGCCCVIANTRSKRHHPGQSECTKLTATCGISPTSPPSTTLAKDLLNT